MSAFGPPPIGAPHGPPPAPMGAFGPPPIGAPPVIQMRTGGGRGMVMGFMIFIFAMVGLIFAISGVFVFQTMRTVNEAVTSATQMTAPAPTAAITTSAGAADANATCDRARRCCNAYVEAIGQPQMTASICGSVEQGARSPMPDAVCGGMINGWRQSLAGMQKAIPADCQ